MDHYKIKLTKNQKAEIKKDEIIITEINPGWFYWNILRKWVCHEIFLEGEVRKNMDLDNVRIDKNISNNLLCIKELNKCKYENDRSSLTYILVVIFFNALFLVGVLSVYISLSLSK